MLPEAENKPLMRGLIGLLQEESARVPQHDAE